MDTLWVVMRVVQKGTLAKHSITNSEKQMVTHVYDHIVGFGLGLTLSLLKRYNTDPSYLRMHAFPGERSDFARPIDGGDGVSIVPLCLFTHASFSPFFHFELARLARL